jgi:hypothetical protein
VLGDEFRNRRSLDRSSDRRWPVVTGIVRNHQIRKREQTNARTLTGTIYDGFVNRRSAVRVCPSAPKIPSARIRSAVPRDVDT